MSASVGIHLSGELVFRDRFVQPSQRGEAPRAKEVLL
jgi:hypothetical protein